MVKFWHKKTSTPKASEGHNWNFREAILSNRIRLLNRTNAQLVQNEKLATKALEKSHKFIAEIHGELVRVSQEFRLSLISKAMQRCELENKCSCLDKELHEVRTGLATKEQVDELYQKLSGLIAAQQQLLVTVQNYCKELKEARQQFENSSEILSLKISKIAKAKQGNDAINNILEYICTTGMRENQGKKIASNI